MKRPADKPKKVALYDPSKIEAKWQKKWASSKIYKSTEDSKKDNYYVLDMFPYPSGEGLHVGHPKGYIATDIVSRYQRMKGKSVLHPMGFDAFGLPAENYALKTKTNPADSVKKNVARYKKQLEILGFDYDWSREINTTDPNYYKWTQWIFLQLFKRGLAYESYEPINWCPVDKTGLANEDVENGRCERCGALVEKRPMRQWVLRITDYAERLLKDLDTKDKDGKAVLDWPESIKELQRNWIGRSEGAEIDFRIELKKNKPRFVILHGYEGSAHTNFIPWLKKELEKRGHEVQAPELPNSNNPTETEQVEYVLKNCTLDENTVVIGHSLGAVVALKVIMKLNKPISGLVVVAAAIDPAFKDAEPRPYAKNFTWNFNYEQIKKLASGRIAVLSDTQENLRGKYLKHLASQLGAWLKESKAVKEHFCAEQEPAILESVTPNIKVFTTRPDTIYGVTYLVLAPEHPWVSELLPRVENRAEVEAYISKTQKETEIERTDASKEKTGVELKNVRAINPATNEEVPVWIADYVLADYGTGAVMAVPAHDERDFEFAKKFNLPVKQVVASVFKSTSGNDAVQPNLPFMPREAVMCIIKHWEKDEYICLQWKDYPEVKSFVSGGIEDGEDIVETGRREIREETGYTNPKFIRRVGMDSYSEFYHQVKKKNVRAYFRYLYFELENGEQVPVAQEETDRHSVIWKKKDEVLNFLSLLEKETIWRDFLKGDQAQIERGYLINSGKFDGLHSNDVMKSISESVGGKWVSIYKLRNWVFSRQRYWGEPIPVIHCDECGVVPVPEKDLPVKLPKVKSYEPTGTGESPLAAIKSWVNVKCPQCKGKAKRETNTMPQWAGSSWYYLRFEDPKNKKVLVDPKKEKYWSPVDLYVGGAEHATRHLIYARFWHKFLYDIGVVSTIEPFTKLQHVGLIMGEDGRKMSKRFGNVINPDDIVKTYGADTLRLYEMFMGPFDQQVAWSTDGIVGPRRFIEKVWRLKEKMSTDTSSNATRAIHKAIKKVTDDIKNLRFNTAISSLMIAVNDLEKAPTIGKGDYESLLKLLAPFAPHVTEELWTSLGNKKSIHLAEWPSHDESLAADSETTIVVQVNGKVRGSFKAEANTSKEELERQAREVPEVKKWLEGKQVEKIIVVPNRLVNIVLTN
jgi:leucyl-tRNA synthetase